MALSPTSWGTGGGGAAAPTEHAGYSGLAVNVPNNSSAYLTVDTLDQGTALLDITDPATPLVLVDGVYAVSIVITNDNVVTAGGYYNARLTLGSDEEAIARTSSPVIGTAGALDVSLALTWYLSTEDFPAVSVQVTNKDGVNDANFYLSLCNVQRVS